MLSSKITSTKSIAGTVLILTVVIQGCGGGGGSGGVGGNSGAGGKVYAVNTATNASKDDVTSCSEIDVASGAITPLFLDSTFCYPIDGGNHFLTIDTANITTGEVEEVDRQGKVLKHFTVSNPRTSVPWPPAQSPDGQYVIVPIDTGFSYGEIHDWSGQLIASYEGADAWDWFSDGSLLLVANDALYRANPPDFHTASLIQSFPGYIVTGAFISPDQSRISIQMKGGDEPLPNIWTMNSDGSGLTKVTNVSGGGPYLGNWSPDGSTIFIRLKYLCPQLYSIPSNGSNLTLSHDNPSPGKLISENACLFSPPIFVN